MAWQFNAIEPIYLQIADRLMGQIIRGVYGCGDRLPSVREFALSAEVNPNTIQRAFMELQNKGLVVTESTAGKFVTKNEETIREIKDALLAAKTETFLNSLNSYGITKEQLIIYLKGDKTDG